MTYFTRDIIGAEILLYAESALLGPVLDLIFSPEDGSVVGFVCFDPIQKKKMVFAPSAVRRMTGRRMLIDGHDSLADLSDLVRVAEASKVGAKIIGEQVLTRSGQKLGKVTAATIDTTHWRLNRLYVNSTISINLLARELIIPAKRIEKIEKKKIYVTDDDARVRSAQTRQARAID